MALGKSFQFSIQSVGRALIAGNDTGGGGATGSGGETGCGIPFAGCIVGGGGMPIAGVGDGASGMSMLGGTGCGNGGTFGIDGNGGVGIGMLFRVTLSDIRLPELAVVLP